jgi:hypothetical protein
LGDFEKGRRIERNQGISAGCQKRTQDIIIIYLFILSVTFLSNRMTIVDEYTVRIMGTVLPHSPSRRGPVSSQYDARRKSSTSSSLRWLQEFRSLGCAESDVTHLAQEAANTVESLEKAVKKLKKQVSQRESMQMRASRLCKEQGRGKELYNAFKEARQAARDARRELIPQETALHAKKRTLYYWNNVLKGAKADMRAAGKGKDEKEKRESKGTAATWSHFTVEDATEHLDISKLITNCRGKNRQVVFAGTDYGVSKMSETCVQTMAEIETHINRYKELFGTWLYN